MSAPNINRENALDNEKRKDIIKLLYEVKGPYFSEVKRKIGVMNGTLAYHMSILEKFRYVKSGRDGKLRRFFLYEDQMPPYSTVKDKITKTVRKNPRISHDTLTSRIFIRKDDVEKQIGKMVHEGILIENATGSTLHYRLNPTYA